ncbi:MAG: peptidase domain-containing ABC transporter [Bacteroidota bacterium]
MRIPPRCTVRQRDVSDCGAACIASVAAFYHLQLPVSSIRQVAGTDQKGTNVLGLVKALNRFGFQAKGVKGSLSALPGVPLPAIAHVVLDNRLLHYLVIYRVTGSKVIVMDPGSGGKKVYSRDAFEKIWTGILVILAPGTGFKPGKQVISRSRRLLFLLKPHRTVLCQALFGAIIYTILGLSTSIYIEVLTDRVMVTGNLNLLHLMGIVMILIILFQLFLNVMKNILVLKTGQKIDARLITGYFRHLLRLPQDFFDTMRTGEIISRINDAVKIRAFINDTAITLIVNVLIVFFSFLLMFLYHRRLALIMLTVIPFYLTLYIIYNALNRKQERRIMESSAELESQLVESVRNLRTIKQFGLEEWTGMKTEGRFLSLLETVYRSGVNSVFSSGTSEFIGRIFTVVLLWAGTGFVLDSLITPGKLLSFYSLLGYFTGPVISLIGMNKLYQNALIAADRLFEIMDLERERDEEQGIELTESGSGDIVFESVHFGYRTRAEVLKGLDLRIRKGEVTALTGESGSGKTTIAALLQAVYPLESGRILIGGYPLDRYTLSSVRNMIGLVPQNLDLFSGTIAENIAPGEFRPDMSRVLKICNDLGMNEFIEGLPYGIFTMLGENGINLSGGQRQKLAIARALYRDPSYLIFDEATSSLDSVSEHYLQQVIARLRREGKTVILIAHRLSTLQQADRIAVLHEGRIAESGSHDELLEAGGRYRYMWDKQTIILQKERIHEGG